MQQSCLPHRVPAVPARQLHRIGVNSPALPAADPAPDTEAPQRIVKIRRDYNSWVASETLEDYALRYTPQRFRKWSEWRVANTAFGAASFLILEAVGATLLVQYGFVNAFNPLKNWYDHDVIGIDTGVTMLMAENLRTGFVWETFMKTPEAQRGMERAGFVKY